MRALSWELPYASRRSPVLAANVVATSHPLAVQAGLCMLGRGGNAVDAAVATAITLTVVEPTNNGIGSDAFAIVAHGGKLFGLNASGRSPAAWSPARFAGRTAMPATGWESVTVPGAVSAWTELSSRFGTLPFETLFEPAIRYARDGAPVSPIVAEQWALQGGLLASSPGFAEAFLPGGSAPQPGTTFRCPNLADSLEEIAATRGESFYRGKLAARIVASAREGGAALTAEDLASHRAEPMEPLSVSFGGARIHELPPNTQGLATLIALGILEKLSLDETSADSIEDLHLQIEATKVALSTTRRCVGDPVFMTERPGDLLSPESLGGLASRIDPRRARPMEGPAGRAGDTVLLCAADASGTLVSLIQSNFFGFGSGVVVPGTGISLQNRAAGFSLEPGHPNEVGGGKRPFHTLIPGFVTHGGTPWMAFGLMGGPMQAQGHVQLMTRILLHGQNPQAAADAPRWQVLGGLDLAVEPAFPSSLREGLEGLGHQVRELPPLWFGGAQIVARLGDVWIAASDPRKDGQAAGF